MLKEYKMQAILGVWGGILFFAFGTFLFSASRDIYSYFALVIMLGGYILFICGCFMYVKGKGQNGFLGLFGILGPIGLLILYILKDNSKILLKERSKRKND